MNSWKPPPDYNPIQRMSWYAGLVIAAILLLTAAFAIGRLLIAFWQWILGL